MQVDLDYYMKDSLDIFNDKHVIELLVLAMQWVALMKVRIFYITSTDILNATLAWW